MQAPPSAWSLAHRLLASSHLLRLCLALGLGEFLPRPVAWSGQCGGADLRPSQQRSNHAIIAKDGVKTTGEYRAAYIKERGLRGTDRPRPLRKLGSLSAPRLCGDILGPMPCALPLFPPRSNTRKIRPGPYSARRQRVRTPEAGPLPYRQGSGLAICLGPLMSAGTSGAATLIPRSRRSASSRPHGRGMG
jgi:hypothetical protein